MGPKKKERDIDVLTSSSNKGTISNNGRVDPVQADRELFLQAFESMYNLFLLVLTSSYSVVCFALFASLVLSVYIHHHQASLNNS